MIRIIQLLDIIFKMNRCLFQLFCLAFLATATSKPIEVLFVGNSFTHGKYLPVLQYNNQNNPGGITDLNYGLPPSNPRYESDPDEPGPWGGIPGIFAMFAKEAGLDYQVSIEAVSGQSLKFQANPANLATPVIYQSKWDVVVLQELSTRPVPADRDGNEKAFLEAVFTLEENIHAQNPNCDVYLYQTWATASTTYPPGEPYFGQPIETMGNDLFVGYSTAVQLGANCQVSPVGNAWLRTIELGIAVRNPYLSYPDNQIDLWGQDHKHPSIYGSYLNALVLFASITGVDPRHLGYENAAQTFGIAPETTRYLEEIAYRIINQKSIGFRANNHSRFVGDASKIR